MTTNKIPTQTKNISKQSYQAKQKQSLNNTYIRKTKSNGNKKHTCSNTHKQTYKTRAKN